MAEPLFAGWHGKLPTLGDFATRRLDAAFVDTWDRWLSEGLAALRQGPDWLPAYLASPSWRFLLLPGVLPGDLGRCAWAGVLMPSVDRVGRYYPLTLAAALPSLPQSANEVEALWTWLVRLDEAAADALHEDWAIDALEAELLRLPLPAMASPGAAELASPASGVQSLALGPWPHPGAMLAAQAAQAFARQARGQAFWSAQPEQGDARLLVSAGLDRGPLIARLLGAVNDNPA